MRKHYYDVIIIGAGPAGLFAAYELQKHNNALDVLIIDKGVHPDFRHCPMLVEPYSDCSCKVCGLVQGGGGAGLFSDGKLVLDLNSGGHLREMAIPFARTYQAILNDIEETLQKFNGNSVVSNPTGCNGAVLTDRLRGQNLALKTYKVRHFGSCNLRSTISGLIDYLQMRGVKFAFDCEIVDFEVLSDTKKAIVKYKNDEFYLRCSNLIFAVGKFGAAWLESLLTSFGIKFKRNRVYMGVRVEVPAHTLSGLLAYSFDPKIYTVFEDGTKMKTHCFCRNGEVIMMKYGEGVLVGGHTMLTENNAESSNTPNYNSNFAILLGDTEEEPLSDEQLNKYLSKINAQCHNRLMVQRWEDFKLNRATTPEQLEHNSIRPSNFKNCIAGNIAGLNLPLEFNRKLLAFMNGLNSVAFGLDHPDTLIYAPALEWSMKRVEVSNEMEIAIPGVYAVGDGAGLSQGIVHAAATGIIAALSIVERKTNPKELALI